MNLPSDTLPDKMREHLLFKAGYAAGLHDAHMIVGAHIPHVETVEEAHLLSALGRAIHEILMTRAKA